jgi:hypothetical protein
MTASKICAPKMGERCKDIVKYALLNVLRQSNDADPQMYVTKKLLVFSNIHGLHSNNQVSLVKANNLYALLYSKYYAQRFVLQNNGQEDAQYEDDEDIQKRFREMLKVNFASKTQFDDAYLDIVRSLKDQKVYDSYVALNGRMEQKELQPGDEKNLFSVGCSETDIFLERKLSEDVSRFLDPFNRHTAYLKKYCFLNGWITAAGVSTLILLKPIMSVVIKFVMSKF